MAKQMKYMERLYGSPLYEFLPPTCVMPTDYGKRVARYFMEKQVLGAQRSYWI